jgi:hypothetical protein
MLRSEKMSLGKMNHHMKGIKLTVLVFCLSIISNLHATPHAGMTISLPIITKEPESLHGFQVMFNYDPDRFKWRKFNVYFDGGYSHFWVNSTPYYSTISIYSVAPVVRYNFKQRGPVTPYIELSIGLSYLNHTRIENRNLGIHFAFQDRMGIGAIWGSRDQFLAGIHFVHYSNAHLADHNAGITIPMALDIGYRFW